MKGIFKIVFCISFVCLLSILFFELFKTLVEMFKEGYRKETLYAILGLTFFLSGLLYSLL